MRAPFCFTALALLATGCDPHSEKAFIAGRSQNACIEVIPACPEATASCVLDPTQYAEARFPGSFDFMVDARAQDTIQVQMFIKLGEDSGQSTDIYWYEPGCSDRHTWSSNGLDIFAEAAETNVFAQSRKVNEPGEHLIEIFSDMMADVLVAVDVIQPGTR